MNMDLCKKIKFVILTIKLKNEYKKINDKRLELTDRSNKYHNGRMEICSQLKNDTSCNIKKIGKLKRQIIKEDLHSN